MKKFFRKEKSSPAPASENPYAQPPPTTDPYANDAHQQATAPPMAARQNSRPGPGPGLPSGPRVGLPSGPRGGAPPPQRPEPAQPATYGADKYGASDGYGARRYNQDAFNQNQSISAAAPGPRPGGYGGMGAAPQRDYRNAEEPRYDSRRDTAASTASWTSEAPTLVSTNSSRSQAETLFESKGGSRNNSQGGYGGFNSQREQQQPQQPPPPYDRVTSQADTLVDEPRGNQGGYGGMGLNNRRQDAPGVGYGGLGRADSSSTTADRDALYGAARNRLDGERPNRYGSEAPNVDNRYAQGGASGVAPGSFGGYGEQRELTEQEREDQQYQDTKMEKKQITLATDSALDRSLAHLNFIEETGDEIDHRLAANTDSLNNVEKRLDVAKGYNAVALDKAKELRTVNGSMFSVHVANPFTAKKRRQAQDDAVMSRHREEKEEREETRRNHYALKQEVAEARGDGYSVQSSFQPRAYVKDNKYAMSDDDSEEDEANENIDRKMDMISQGLAKVKMRAQARNVHLDRDLEQLDRISQKADFVDDGVRRNRLELDKIR